MGGAGVEAEGNAVVADPGDIPLAPGDLAGSEGGDARDPLGTGAGAGFLGGEAARERLVGSEAREAAVLVDVEGVGVAGAVYPVVVSVAYGKDRFVVEPYVVASLWDVATTEGDRGECLRVGKKAEGGGVVSFGDGGAAESDGVGAHGDVVGTCYQGVGTLGGVALTEDGGTAGACRGEGAVTNDDAEVGTGVADGSFPALSPHRVLVETVDE